MVYHPEFQESNDACTLSLSNSLCDKLLDVPAELKQL